MADGDPKVQAEINRLVADIISSGVPRAEAWKKFQSAPHALELDELHAIALTGLAQAAARFPEYNREHGYEPDDFRYFQAYCVTPDVKVLTADLRWVPIGDVKVGHELVGVEEYSGGRGKHRKLLGAEVLEVSRRMAPCLRVHLADGREVTCSVEHRWLVARRAWQHTGYYGWFEARTLKPGERLASQMRPWEQETSFGAGWLAGIIDGEGSYLGVPGCRRGIQITQNEGIVLDRITAELDKLGVYYAIHSKSKSDKCVRVDINQLWAVLKLVGSVRPVRFDSRPLWDGRAALNRKLGGPNGNSVEVSRVEDAGVREVVTIETSTGTYLAEGLVAHNCLRRIRGAMLDAMRSQDWVTRSARTRVKAIREAGQDQGRTTAELARATGLTEAEVLEAVAAVSRKPVSIDAEPHDVADPGDVEGQAVVASVLGAASAVLRGLPAYVQVIIVLRHFHGLPLADAIEAAKPGGVGEEVAAEAYQAAILEVHSSMLKAVS